MSRPCYPPCYISLLFPLLPSSILLRPSFLVLNIHDDVSYEKIVHLHETIWFSYCVCSIEDVRRSTHAAYVNKRLQCWHEQFTGGWEKTDPVTVISTSTWKVGLSNEYAKINLSSGILYLFHGQLVNNSSCNLIFATCFNGARCSRLEAGIYEDQRNNV